MNDAPDAEDCAWEQFERTIFVTTGLKVQAYPTENGWWSATLESAVIVGEKSQQYYGRGRTQNDASADVLTQLGVALHASADASENKAMVLTQHAARARRQAERLVGLIRRLERL